MSSSTKRRSSKRDKPAPPPTFDRTPNRTPGIEAVAIIGSAPAVGAIARNFLYQGAPMLVGRRASCAPCRGSDAVASSGRHSRRTPLRSMIQRLRQSEEPDHVAHDRVAQSESLL